MRRVILVLGLVAVVLFVSPTRHSQAHLWACYETAHDNTITFFPGLNYAWFAVAACTSDLPALKVGVRIQYYDWTNEEWKNDPAIDPTIAYEANDDAIIAFGGLNIPPFGGINCRRVSAFFYLTDIHHGDIDTDEHTEHSNGECY